MPVYLHDEASVMRFKVQGALVGSCVTELESSCRTAASVLRGKTLVLDLTGVTSIDEAGRELLARMQREGPQLITESRVGGSIPTGVSGRQAANTQTRPSRRLLERLRGLLHAGTKAHEGT